MSNTVEHISIFKGGLPARAEGRARGTSGLAALSGKGGKGGRRREKMCDLSQDTRLGPPTHFLHTNSNESLMGA